MITTLSLQKLSKYFKLSEIGELQEDSSNIVQLLGEAFKVQESFCYLKYK